ncbi:MAG: helix-turn-helix domain-containing protein [Tannerella sp.]|jgi:AraC-like DNA-binding protein|nr:helix-turn-helix domain-containing protein [Tannerella sp.]
MIAQLIHDLENLKGSLIAYENFQNGILIAEIDYSSFGINTDEMIFPAPARNDALTFIGVMNGAVELSVDYITHRISANGIAWIMPTHISQLVRITQDFKGWILLISKSFMDENGRPHRNSTPLISYMQLKKHPFSPFEPDEFSALYESLQVMQERMKQHTHLFQKEIILNALKAFMLDMGNFFFSKKENIFSPILTRKEELFGKFLTLLAKHCKEEHDVSFYAGKLCITPQYLSLALKEQSGRSASRWIQDALIVEAKGMLKSPRVSVQEVANELNFPDQSTFGKFFKKHTHLSPVAFRKL